MLLSLCLATQVIFFTITRKKYNITCMLQQVKGTQISLLYSNYTLLEIMMNCWLSYVATAS